MSLARFSVNQSVLINILFFCGIIAGGLVLSDIDVDVFPNVSFAQAKITTTWLGASAEDVELFITRKIEEEIDEVQGVDRIVSQSQKDASFIDVKFREDLSESQFESYFNDLRSALERVADLPDDAEEPRLEKITVNEIYPLVQAVIVDETAEEGKRLRPERELVLRAVAKELRKNLLDIPDVMRVNDFAIRDREVRIAVSRDRLDQHDLTILEVYEAVRRNHINLPVGPLDRSGDEIALRAVGEFDEPEALLDLEIGRPGGLPLRLRDVARLEEDFERQNYVSRYNGRPSLNLGVHKRDGSDSISVRDAVFTAIEEFRGRALPEGVRIETAIDTTKVIKNRIGVLRNNLISGSLLVFVALWLFMGARNSVLAISGMPFAFLMTFVLIAPMGITLNAITLFSLVLVSGMLVDEEIVVLENIYRHIELGKPLKEAIVVGVQEVLWPVVASALTTIAAFLPLLLMEGVVGVFLSIIPKTVTVCLIASLVECSVSLPAHYLHIGPREPATMKLGGFFEALRTRYLRVLDFLLARPKTVIIVVTLMALASLPLAASLPTNLFPSDFQAFYVNLVLPTDSSLTTTDAATAEVERVLSKVVDEGGIEAYSSSVGVLWTTDNQLLLRPNVCQILVSVTDEVANDGDSDALIRRVREAVTQHTTSPECGFRFERVEVDSFQDGPPIGKPVAVRVRTPDLDLGKSIARRIVDELSNMPGVYGVDDNLDVGGEEAQVVPKRDRSAIAGVDFETIALTARAANEGLEAGILTRADEDDELELRVVFDRADRSDVEGILGSKVRMKSGMALPLSEAADLRIGRSWVSRYHYDTHRCVLVTADVDNDKATSASVNDHLKKRFESIEREHPGVHLTFGGEFEETQRSFRSAGYAFIVAVITIFAILAAQFKSYVQPLIIIVAVPLAFVGVVLGLALLGFPITIMTMIAIIGLAGVSVNNAIVLVDFVNGEVARGMTLIEAVKKACHDRLRPVILTTSTTVLGLLPTALELTGKSKIWAPFAATLCFGLTFATFMTMFVVPVIYMLIDRFKSKRARVTID